MTSATQVARDLIQQEESRVVASWRSLERRLGLLEICRAIDIIRLTSHQQDPEFLEFARQGANKAIFLFMDSSCKERRTPLAPSSAAVFQWALAVLVHCGRIAICEKLLDYERAGLGELRIRGKTVEFEATPKYAGVESVEEHQFDWFREWVIDGQRPPRDILGAFESRVHERMGQLVYRWEEHYLGYEAAPEVDVYFDQEGIFAAQLMVGHDVFDDDAQFGGLPFGFYRAAVWTLIGWAMKHSKFATILLERHPELDAQNLLTVTADVKVLTSELAAVLGVSTDEAKRALDVLELNLDNSKSVCISGQPLPPLIRAASEQFVRPVSGFLDEPFQFMLRQIRATHTQDWDRAVNNREARFREEVLDLFPQEWIKKLGTNITVRSGGRKITDIDAAMVDEKNCVVGLFQLKWQDPFGHIMRERASRMKNFYYEAGLWINAIIEFLRRASQFEVSQMLGISLKSDRRIDYRLFVVGRYFAHFSGDVLPDSRAAWATWAQLMRIAEETEDSTNPIVDLYSGVISDSPMAKRLRWKASSFQLGEITVSVKGRNASEE